MLYAGIDLGTTHTKAILCDENGHLLWEQKLLVHTHHPQQGWHEQNPLEIWQNLQTLLLSLAKLVNEKGEKCRICFSSAMHSIMAVNESGLPLSPLLTWADLRTAQLVDELRNQTNALDLYNATGTPLHPMSPLCKIVWFRTKYNDLFQKNFKWVSAKDYIWWQLTGSWQADHSVASASGLFNIRERRWHPAALELAGISEAQLPETVSVMHRVQPGRMPPGCGQWKQVPEFQIGGSDGFLANLGSDATEKGVMALTIGTSGAVRVLNDGPVDFEKTSLFQYAADEGRWLLGGAVNNGGNLLAWFSEVFLQGNQTTERVMQYWLDRAAQVPRGCDGLACTPWVFGERAPVWDANARASFSGIHSGHGKEHFLRAILEGVANNIAVIVKEMENQGVEIRQINASGGFIASPLWVHIMEETLGKKIYITNDADASARGAVVLARRNAPAI